MAKHPPRDRIGWVGQHDAQQRVPVPCRLTFSVESVAEAADEDGLLVAPAHWRLIDRTADQVIAWGYPQTHDAIVALLQLAAVGTKHLQPEDVIPVQEEPTMPRIFVPKRGIQIVDDH